VSDTNLTASVFKQNFVTDYLPLLVFRICSYDDLNQLITTPRDLEFTLELIEVSTPDQYEKETWQMDEIEKLAAVPRLKEEGNNLYRNKEYAKASQKYSMAIGILEQLMIKYVNFNFTN